MMMATEAKEKAQAGKTAAKKDAPAAQKPSVKGQANAPQAAESKPHAKGAQKAEHKDAKKKPKAEKKSRKVIVKKSAQIIAMRRKALARAGHPVFRGRFGSRSIRKKANAKWDKWRFPRGLDVNHELSEGFTPRAGYGTPNEIRHVHPGGQREFMARTVADLEKAPAGHALRVAAGMGSRKKMALVDRAIEKGIKVLNP